MVTRLKTNTMSCSYNSDYRSSITYNHGNDTASANRPAQHHMTQ